MANEDFSQSSTAPETSYDRAKRRVAEYTMRKQAELSGDPLSPEGQAVARINAANEAVKVLSEYRETIAGSGNYTSNGIGELLKPEKEKARSTIQSLLADHEKAGEALLEQARAISQPPVLEFTDADQRVMQAFNALPAEQRAKIRREALSGKHHKELVRALLAGPSFASQLDPKTRARLERQFDGTDPAKREALLDKARAHSNSTLALQAAMAEINAV